MKSFVEETLNRGVRKDRKRLSRVSVLGGLVIVALIWTLALDIPFTVRLSHEAVAADYSGLRGIDNPDNLPMLLDFGRGVCIPCKMMKPVLEEVAREYDGKLLVRIVEIDQYRELRRQFRIHLIPTQVFIDSKGKVFHRHEGFMDKASIVMVLNRMGIKK